MAQETEPVAATLDAPSPKRRNRKKGRRGSTAGADDDGDGDEAAADLISLPSPVAATSSSAVDVFATLEMEQAVDELALTQATDTKPVKQQEDGLLKLPIHPSSGRVPLTPPPTPEPFLVHSPEKEQSRVAPMSTLVETPPTQVEVPVETQVDAATGEEGAPTSVDWATPAGTDDATAVQKKQQTPDAAVEQETSALSNILADMTLANGRAPAIGSAEKPASAAVAEMLCGEQPQVPVADDNASPTAHVQVNSISASPTAEPTTVPSGEAAVSKIAATTALPMTVVLREAPIVPEAAFVETPVATQPVSADTPKPTESAPSELPEAIKPVQAEIPAEAAALVSLNEEKKTLPESLQLPRRNKRKGDSPEPKLQPTPATTSRLFSKAHPNKALASSTTGESAGSLKQATTKDSSETQPPPRPAKRKGDTTDVKPPPAPTTATVVAKEIRPKRLVARSNVGSTLNKAKPGPEAKLKPGVIARPAHDNKKESMMNPTASSMARATAAEARKALQKSAAAKRTPARKPMRTKSATTSAVPVPNGSSAQDESVLAPPAPTAADDADDSQRNVKRRLNVTDAEAVSKRLYEDAKEAKARKDARRAELQENYTFAPQVNNVKRRTAPGETEDANQDRFTRLHAQAKELQERKRGLQQQHEREGCTFAPTISARAKRLAQPSSGPRYENLYKHAQEMKQKREEKLLEQTKTTEEQCPFKPKITTSKSPVKTKPLYDFEREKLKRLALEQKKIESEMSECTFKPKVSAKRMKSKPEGPSDAATDRATDANPYNRLYQASIDRTERLQRLRQERDDEEKAQAPFQPKITARSRMLKTKAKTKEPFHKRLYNKDYMKMLDADREQRRLEEEQQFTFKPEINEPPEEIKAKVNERASPRKTIFERLYDEKDKMKEKIEMGEELRLQKEMAECTFRPQIEVDTVQSSGDPAPPVWERLLSYDKAQVIEEREKLKEQLEMQECTFKPEVKSPEAHLMKRSPSFNVFDRLTGSGSNSPLDPARANFITRRPSSSPGRQSPDTKGASIGRIIKLTKFSLPTERKKPSRAYSISQPSSVNKPAMKRSTSFSGPKSAAASPTMSTADILSGLVSSRQAEAATTSNEDATLPHSITNNYESWSAELDAKLRHL
ncbi:hypothetical protein PHYPSEUDO_012827 [Phytophthora pseudosyringae]|uniref:Uncharacterized protein n=1 Tax=Phytophthora pseudosyringae TaxID=221518 RepID=A0A8T1W4Q1_9STRA|nr:hypothetical protein PHYPSEUDO_012827 [Phytophthora pseudosyringae]